MKNFIFKLLAGRPGYNAGHRNMVCIGAFIMRRTGRLDFPNSVRIYSISFSLVQETGLKFY